ncbi:hypothetical protein T484DRAFT_1845031 [Baffinella frigidus]|nr:hypothetical protein T484DRAFT_1845031 [Cryptophyta sp. CCMP2293]
MLSASPLFAVLLSGIALMPVASAFVPAALVGGVRAHASLAPQPGSGRSSLFRLHQPHRTLGLRMAAGEGLGGGESGLEGAGGGGTPEGASADQMRYLLLQRFL